MHVRVSLIVADVSQNQVYPEHRAPQLRSPPTTLPVARPHQFREQTERWYVLTTQMLQDVSPIQFTLDVSTNRP